MKVEDVMTRDVVDVAPDTQLKAVAETLARHRISGVPVVEDGAVVGVVSEADVIEQEAAEKQPTLLARLAGRDRHSQKAKARTARQAMTAPAVTVPPRFDVAQAARLMVERRINRLPVVTESGELVGIVTRADLVRAFVRTDAEIEREVREDVALRTLWLDPDRLEVAVRDGEVTLRGDLDTRADAELLERLTARVPGVVAVRSELRWRLDEPRLPVSDPRVPQPPPHR
ncbi:MAG TPA: CBS domain-containing protein [Gaiellaceae bacterium]|nr:CBS domain-containing protein [Gaiellaceae bacterium]